LCAWGLTSETLYGGQRLETSNFYYLAGRAEGFPRRIVEDHPRDSVILKKLYDCKIREVFANSQQGIKPNNRQARGASDQPNQRNWLIIAHIHAEQGLIDS
jgi:hypothetical protein